MMLKIYPLVVMDLLPTLIQVLLKLLKKCEKIIEMSYKLMLIKKIKISIPIMQVVIVLH